ncbi:hypothetical protein PHYPSEUDO_004760 [Phytophthora pseudosyringae]|uniref:Uncharacterized protein n=1 Tax=Phytophthora pseudosyringae TaxID=221518 RepID=A0A8T1VN32_9STRA|nr:hypothetical protein PHYPSEUDO_004760 [Phytophthora pseudosyringae]
MDSESELQRLEANHSELLLHQETLKKQLDFKSDQLKYFQAAVKEAQALLGKKPSEAAMTELPCSKRLKVRW